MPAAHACTAGSMNRPSALLEPDQLARVLERLGDLAVGEPADQPVEPVGAAEQQDLDAEVAPALGQEARGEAGGERPHGAARLAPRSPSGDRGADRTRRQRVARWPVPRRSSARAGARRRRRSAPARAPSRRGRTSTSVQPEARSSDTQPSPATTVQYGEACWRTITAPGRVASRSNPSAPAAVRRAAPDTGGSGSRTSQMRQFADAWTGSRNGRSASSRPRSIRAEKSSGAVGSATQRTAFSCSQAS